ncbi:DUF7289 family protein [Natrinema ejinorense]|uniref:Uncharacterized protein n=1 Tax=Natrinema ejinorense TaxID=373386 RepID=A0A2A5QVM8_9EURY|nr:hypothetical protein [Natrinema ejinorense]PCR90887.1 hypothetical protein CP557_10370 [Natrinema ejinorense]
MRSNRDRPATFTDSRDRGVSEVLAFILVFATIMGSVALLSTVGFQTMADFQEGEQLRNSERAMIALADNFNTALHSDSIETRNSELAVRGGTVTTGNGGTVVSIDFESSESGTIDRDVPLGVLAYQSGSDTIAYEGGGVVRSDGEGSVALKNPQLRCTPGSGGSDNGTAIISLVAIDSANRSIQTSGTLELEMNVTNHERTVYDVTGSNEVTVTSSSDYTTAWDGIRSTGGWSGGTCEHVDQAAVTVVTVDITYPNPR